MLLERLGPKSFNDRDLVCGDAYAFQGDERDVIFLTMVAAAKDTGRIGVLSKESDKRRFNVAASRARDQMWLFHSVQPDDLSPLCLRRQFLEYCLDPRVMPSIAVDGISVDELQQRAFHSRRGTVPAPQPFDSWFEVDVYLALARRGYRVLPQYEIAGCRIDLVVEGMQGRLAIECDGDAWHGADRFDADMARQRMLERCGMRFWRVRGSAYYLNPDAALNSLWRILGQHRIYTWAEQKQSGTEARSSCEGASAKLQTAYS